jgi:hypothetical protein
MLNLKSFAQLAQEDDSFRQITYACLVLLVLAVVGFVGVAWARKYARTEDTPSGGGFSLDELRRLQREGKLSDQEFQKAISLITRAVQRDAAPKLKKSDDNSPKPRS